MIKRFKTWLASFFADLCVKMKVGPQERILPALYRDVPGDGLGNRDRVWPSDVVMYAGDVFIEEALHRLVEIHYHIGLEDEAKKYAKILGYNYNSSKWFEQTYIIFNKDYKLPEIKNDKDKDGFLKKIIKKIR